jgi:hypothetical protein
MSRKYDYSLCAEWGKNLEGGFLDIFQGFFSLNWPEGLENMMETSVSSACKADKIQC